MTKTILELCQSLPDSEPELRARAGELAAEIAERVMGWRAVYLRAHKRNHSCYIGGHYPTREACAADCAEIEECEPVLFWANASGDTFGKTEDNWNPLVSIADAKAATDAMQAAGAKSLEIYCREADAYRCAVLVRNLSRGHAEWVKVEAEASTEPLTRSACALLAAMAMNKGDRK